MQPRYLCQVQRHLHLVQFEEFADNIDPMQTQMTTMWTTGPAWALTTSLFVPRLCEHWMLQLTFILVWCGCGNAFVPTWKLGRVTYLQATSHLFLIKLRLTAFTTSFAGIGPHISSHVLCLSIQCLIWSRPVFGSPWELSQPRFRWVAPWSCECFRGGARSLECRSRQIGLPLPMGTEKCLQDLPHTWALAAEIARGFWKITSRSNISICQPECATWAMLSWPPVVGWC